MRAPHTATTLGSAAPARDGPAQQVARFGRHVAEMCAVMCVTLILTGLAVTAAAAALGTSNPITGAPAATAAVATLALAASMTAWMRYRAMDWRPTLEMAGSTIAAGAVMLTGYAAGVVPADALVGGTCGLACVAMVAVMLFRFRLYASHAHHAPSGH
ncbi:hypothetical protein SAMN05216199_0270 [Pedococcus cremeus]|uniref:Transmembrane protein n=1 Tax=Pedococcus cremeus TaxID=587636 RepID=A0A1H9XTG1_9MICO|nr:hypothetical protein [Pedococcus cremeus]SES49007.1 hypothetical protein SAMN05216199_0270 [Pedococcus cremeus]